MKGREVWFMKGREAWFMKGRDLHSKNMIYNNKRSLIKEQKGSMKSGL